MESESDWATDTENEDGTETGLSAQERLLIADMEKLVQKRTPSVKRPRRVMFDNTLRLNVSEVTRTQLQPPTKFQGMGTHEIVQRMADRGHILFMDGMLKWVGPTANEEKNDHNRSWAVAEEGEESTRTLEGGLLCPCAPMAIEQIMTPKWRFRRKNRPQTAHDLDQQNSPAEQGAVLAQQSKKQQETLERKKRSKPVNPSSVVPVSVGSMGSSSSENETDPECLVTDEEEDAEALGETEGWLEETVSRSPSPAVVPPQFVFQEEEPQFIFSEPLPEAPPTKKRKQKHDPQPHTDGKIYPKPAFSYSCLIAMALKNSRTGSLPVSEIYKFMCDHFPYFKSAPSGWKNSVRHNLSLNKCFEKIEKPGTGTRKGCLWALTPGKMNKMDEEVQKWLKKDPNAILRAMSDPENLELIERGELKRDYSGNGGASDEDDEEDFSELSRPLTPTQVASRGLSSSDTDALLSSTSSPVTMAQIRATLQQQHVRPLEAAVSEEAGALGSGNYLCHPNGSFTLSFSPPSSSTPLIIRRTPVK